MENPLIIHAFEKDGEIYPPVYAECSNCSYSGAAAEYDFGGVEFIYACFERHQNVHNDDWCSSHDLARTKISDEAEEEIERLEELNIPLENFEESLTEEELDEYRGY